MFELRLANGQQLVTENPGELYYFYKSNGARVVPKPRPKKAPRSKKQNKANEVLAVV